MAVAQHLGKGRSRSSVARVILRSGAGRITVNGRPFERYFLSEAARAVVKEPLVATETADKFDVSITTEGGGPTGQAGAAKLGIAQALLEFSAELRAKLSESGMLTRSQNRDSKQSGSSKQRRTRAEVGLIDGYLRTKSASRPAKLVAEHTSAAIERAAEVLGTRDEALRWLGTPVAALDYATPISCLGTKKGLARVNDVLTQVEHGVW